MPWSNSRPRSRKYAGEHPRKVKEAHDALVRAGFGYCAEPRCLERSRLILPGMDLHLSHDTTGTRYLGLSHAQCNRVEASKRARAKQTATTLRW